MEKNKKVLIITYYWPPSGGAGVQRWVKFAKFLPQYGWEPFVLTVDPAVATYPQRDESLINDIPEGVRVFYSPTFELYNLYKKVSSNKEVPYGGFANIRKVNFKEKVLRFIRGNFFLPDPRRGWNRYAYRKAIEIIKEHNIRHIVTTSPPHSTQLIGLKLKKQLAINWIADLRDPWVDIYYYNELYPTRPATMYNKMLERKVIHNCDMLITVSNAFKELFQEKTRVSNDKIRVVYNGYDHQDFEGPFAQTGDQRFVVTYTGTMSSTYKLSGLTGAFKELSGKLKEGFCFRFIGRAPDELTKNMESTLGRNFEYLGFVDHAEIAGHLMSSDALLLVVPDVENNKGIVPGKLLEYLAARRPVLLLGPDDCEAAAIIRETNGGLVCEPSDTEAITQALMTFINSKKQNSPRYTGNQKVDEFSRARLTQKLAELLNSLS